VISDFTDVERFKLGTQQRKLRRRKIKAYVGFMHRLKNGWYRTLDFRAESVNIGGLDADVPKEIRDAKGNNMLGGVKFGFGRHNRHRYLPTKGKNYEFSYEQVAGSDVFGIVEGTYRWYKTLREVLHDAKLFSKPNCTAAQS
jgi:hypothetical protein